MTSTVVLGVIVIGGFFLLGFMGISIARLARQVSSYHNKMSEKMDSMHISMDDIRDQLSKKSMVDIDKNLAFFMNVKPPVKHKPQHSFSEKGNELGISLAKPSANQDRVTMDMIEKGSLGRPTTHIVRCSSCGNKMVYQKTGTNNLAHCPSCGKSITLH